MSGIKIEELREIVAFAEGRADCGLTFAEISAMWPRIKWLAQAELERRESLPSNLIKHAVDKFLGWKLPADFNPDGGVVFDKMSARKLHPQNHIHEPSGTNLFTADQAKAMFEYCLAGAALSAPVQRWTPIEEAPKDGTEILVTNGREVTTAYWLHNSYHKGWMNYDARTDGYEVMNVTHWMPLPPPPAEGEKM